MSEDDRSDHSLQDSLWVFDGQAVRLWPDVKDLIRTDTNDPSKDLEPSITVPVDFYPLSALLHKGIIMGAESELIQRRGTSFAHFRTVARVSVAQACALHMHS